MALVAALAGGAYLVTRGGSKPTPAARPTTALQLSFSKGQTFRFRFALTGVLTAQVGSQSARVNDRLAGVMSWRVVSVDAKGVARVTVTATGVTDRVNRRVYRQPRQTFHLLVAPDGRVLAAVGFGATSAKGDAGPGVPGIDQIFPLLPNAPVEMGSNWSKDFVQSNPFGKGSIRYATTSTFTGYQSVNGTKAAEIHTTATLPINVTVNERKALAATGQPTSGIGGTKPVDLFAGQMDFSQVALLDPAGKSLIKSTTTGELTFEIRNSGVPPSEQIPKGASIAGTITLVLERI